MITAEDFLPKPAPKAKGRAVTFGTHNLGDPPPKPHKASLTEKVREWCLERKTGILTLDVAAHFDIKPIDAAGILSKLRYSGFLKVTEKLTPKRGGGAIFVCEVA